jgi:septal ring factor EnvC (AmiA/AmiB activator)
MQTKILQKILLVMIAVYYSGESSFAQETAKKETTEQEDIANEFKEAKFLQVDSLKIPKELTRIEEQIKQNAIDVVIHSRTHTPVFAQKLPKGYTESYTKFHGLQVEIVPIPKDEDFYSLNFFYYNWTNRKVDKRLSIRISKYNVLNEMRFGLYELLLGKQYIIDNKDALEKQNFDRIQAVRKTVEEREKEERQKKKEKKKLEEELEQKRLEKE